MFRVIYKSEPISGLAPLEVQQMVAHASSNNAEQNISSFLLRFEHNFLQVLEGEPRPVSSLMDRIWTDRRHKEVSILTSSHDNDVNRYSLNHPLTFVDLRNGADHDEDTRHAVNRGWNFMRQTNQALDQFLDENVELFNKLNGYSSGNENK